MTDIPWGSNEARTFITNVGLITSDGPVGPNIMAAEWTHHISYSPGLIAVCMNKGNQATAENIRKTKQFGVNITATDQSMLSSIAGGSSGKSVDKIKVAQELGFKFYKAKHIKPVMVEGAILNVECKLVQEIPLGSHTMFVGEALDVKRNPNKESLGFHTGKYFKLTETIPKPSQLELDKLTKALAKNKK